MHWQPMQKTPGHKFLGQIGKPFFMLNIFSEEMRASEGQESSLERVCVYLQVTLSLAFAVFIIGKEAVI